MKTKSRFLVLFLSYSQYCCPVREILPGIGTSTDEIKVTELDYSFKSRRKRNILTFLKCAALATVCALSATGGYMLHDRCGDCLESCDNCVVLLEGCAEELRATRTQAAAAMELATKSARNITASLDKAHESCLGIQTKIEQINCTGRISGYVDDVDDEIGGDIGGGVGDLVP